MRRGAPALVAGAWLTLHHLGRTYGSTRAERRRALPGDGLVEGARVGATHAITVAAPPEEVWPWLVQMGWHRAGWYTARWVDRLLFPENLPSADRIVPELQHLDVGDVVPDGPPDSRCGFVVVEEEPLRHLVLRSTSHLPLSWRRRGIAAVDWTWAFVLEPTAGGTRLVFRWRAHARPWWLTLGAHALLVPADFLMSRDMLRGIAARAALGASGRTPPPPRTGGSSPSGAPVAYSE
jgi:hypothetical protein